MATHPVASLLLLAVVVATAVAVVSKDVRPPTPAESAAYLVVTAASYLLSDLLPPALAILYAVIAMKAYPHSTSDEHFSIGAQHVMVQDNGGPKGYSANLLTAAQLDDVPERRRPRIALATPEALHAAQSAEVPQ